MIQATGYIDLSSEEVPGPSRRRHGSEHRYLRQQAWGRKAWYEFFFFFFNLVTYMAVDSA